MAYILDLATVTDYKSEAIVYIENRGACYGYKLATMKRISTPDMADKKKYLDSVPMAGSENSLLYHIVNGMQDLYDTEENPVIITEENPVIIILDSSAPPMAMDLRSRFTLMYLADTIGVIQTLNLLKFEYHNGSMYSMSPLTLDTSYGICAFIDHTADGPSLEFVTSRDVKAPTAKVNEIHNIAGDGSMFRDQFIRNALANNPPMRNGEVTYMVHSTTLTSYSSTEFFYLPVENASSEFRRLLEHLETELQSNGYMSGALVYDKD